jgi:hypothetical protein
MKDIAGSRKAFHDSIRENLIEKHPKMFNALLILALVSLTVAAGFLASDIVSFSSNPSYKGPFSAFDLKISKESITTIKDWQERGLRLIVQGINKGPIKSLDNSTSKSLRSSDKYRARVLLAKNKSAKLKENLAATLRPGLQPGSLIQSNSSQSQSSILPIQYVSLATADGAESGSGSDTPFDNAVYSSSNAVILDISSKDGYIVNESSLNQSRLNQSQMQMNLSKKIPNSLPVTITGLIGINGSILPCSKETSISFNNSSSDVESLVQSQMNPSNSIPAQTTGFLPPDKNDPILLAKPESHLTAEAIPDQFEIPNLKTNDNTIQENEAQKEPPLSMPNQSYNFNFGALEVFGDNISANNISFQINETKQVQISTQTRSVPTAKKKTLPSMPLLNKKIDGNRQNAETKNKEVLSGEGLNKSQEPGQAPLNNGNKFKKLKIQTPSWLGNA